LASVKCDVKETDKGFEITADFPGAVKEDIDLSLDEGVLTISYEKNEEKEDDDDEKSYIVKERSRVSMKRSLMLGDVDENSAKATLENGVLTFTIDKKEPVETKKTIEIG
jgi:HSP20 family protein